MSPAACVACTNASTSTVRKCAGTSSVKLQSAADDVAAASRRRCDIIVVRNGGGRGGAVPSRVVPVSLNTTIMTFVSVHRLTSATPRTIFMPVRPTTLLYIIRPRQL